MANEKHIEIIEQVTMITNKDNWLLRNRLHLKITIDGVIRCLELLQSEHDREIQKIIDQNVKLFNDKDATIRQLRGEIEQLQAQLEDTGDTFLGDCGS